MPPRATRASPAPARYGSHQSAADGAAIAATQASLLAQANAAAHTPAAQSRARASAPGTSGARRLFSLGAAPLQGAIGKGGGRRRNHTKSKAVFSAVRATYQKGELMHKKTGSIYYRGKCNFGKNDKFKDMLAKCFLAETLRWNDALKLYTAKIYTEKQLEKIKEAHKSMDDEEAADLEEAEVDPDLFEFEEFKKPIITSMPIKIEDKMLHAFGGMTYPWKEILKQMGYEFKSNINGQQAQLWVGPDDIKIELMDQFIDYGFELDEYDGLDEQEAEEAGFADHE